MFAVTANNSALSASLVVSRILIVTASLAAQLTCPAEEFCGIVTEHVTHCFLLLFFFFLFPPSFRSRLYAVRMASIQTAVRRHSQQQRGRACTARVVVVMVVLVVEMMVELTIGTAVYAGH